MNYFKVFREIVVEQLEALAQAGTLPEGLDYSRVTVEPPRDRSHGDLATNAAMVLAKPAGCKPRDIADSLAERLRGLEVVVAADVAGPGFINLRLANAVWYERLQEREPFRTHVMIPLS